MGSHQAQQIVTQSASQHESLRQLMSRLQ